MAMCSLVFFGICNMAEAYVLDLSQLFSERAVLAELPAMRARALAQVPAGADVIITGAAPIWLYLPIAHALHGVAARLRYQSPVAGLVLVFDHRVVS
jgi:hypothetical protein